LAGSLAALALGVAVPQAHAVPAATLVDNLSATSVGTNAFGSPSGTGDTDWLAQSFTTTATDYILSSVTALIGNSNQAITGNYIFSIYDDSGSGGVPGVNLGDILSNPVASLTLSSSPITTTASPLPLTLSPNTTYFLVLHTSGVNDTLDWYTASNGSGTGFPTNFTSSSDGGASWNTVDNTGPDQMMQILATAPPPPPVPTPAPLPIFGAAAAFGYSRRLRKRIGSN
jgi:hypothetical protein